LAWRMAQIVGGTAGAAFGVAMFAVACLGAERPTDDRTGLATCLLVGGWIAAVLAGGMARARSLHRSAKLLERDPVVTGDVTRDLAALDAHDPLAELRSAATRRESASLAYPLVALSLLAPLSIHAIAGGLVSMITGDRTGLRQSAVEFVGWIALSAVFSGLAHLVLIGQSVAWARSVRARDAAEIVRGLGTVVARVFGLTVAAALAPAILMFTEAGPLVLLPAGIVAGTALLFVPWMFFASARRLSRQRALLGSGQRAHLGSGERALPGSSERTFLSSVPKVEPSPVEVRDAV
ncbi:MAG TPA: hypothetical protein VH044_05810, partial [Polyangiaceae bacterium]|nr:hypothetical protein [Polyangiaceae bacterium]